MHRKTDDMRVCKVFAKIAQLVEHNLAPKVEYFNLGKCKVKLAGVEYNAKIAQLVEHNLAPKVEYFNLGKCKVKLAGVEYNAKIAQLVEHNLAKVGVAGSSPVFRSQLNVAKVVRE